MVSGKITLLGILYEDANFLKNNFIDNLPEGLINDDFSINDFQKMCVLKTMDMEVLFSNLGTFGVILDSWSKMNKTSWTNEFNRLKDINALNIEDIETEEEIGNKTVDGNLSDNAASKESIAYNNNSNENATRNTTHETTYESERHSDLQRTTGGSDETENQVSGFNSEGYVNKDKSTITYGGTEGNLDDSTINDTTNATDNDTNNIERNDTGTNNKNTESNKTREETVNENNNVNKNRVHKKAEDVIKYSKFVIDLDSEFNIVDRIIEEFKNEFFLTVY